MRSRIGKILIVLGCCCVIAAAAFYMYNQWVSNRAASASEELTGTLSALMAASATSAPEDEDDDPLLDAAEAEATPAADTADGELATVNVDGYDVIGVISIPAIDRELAVISEWSYPNLQISACRYSGAPAGQLIILAHNFQRHFGLINELQPGDAVTFTDVEGNVYDYEVTGTEIKGKYELQDILSGDWDLTLFTCTYGGANRVVVRCERKG